MIAIDDLARAAAAAFEWARAQPGVREVEVLRLMEAGLSNAEIAQALVIALSTVKRHVHNIYGKLAVGSRTAAVARARAFDLL